jgi:hypothetical protein
MRFIAPPQFLRVLLLLAALVLGTHALAQTDPLPSWNDGQAKTAIIELMQAIDWKRIFAVEP